MVYEIRTFDLIGKKLYTFKERPELDRVEDNFRGTVKYVDRETGQVEGYNRNWILDTKKPAGAINEAVEFLPYEATVIEDLPAWVKFEPKRYTGCKLMSQKHGLYLQFWHPASKVVFRIAMNSNYYEPTNK